MDDKRASTPMPFPASQATFFKPGEDSGLNDNSAAVQLSAYSALLGVHHEY